MPSHKALSIRTKGKATQSASPGEKGKVALSLPIREKRKFTKADLDTGKARISLTNWLFGGDVVVPTSRWDRPSAHKKQRTDDVAGPDEKLAAADSVAADAILRLTATADPKKEGDVTVKSEGNITAKNDADTSADESGMETDAWGDFSTWDFHGPTITKANVKPDPVKASDNDSSDDTETEDTTSENSNDDTTIDAPSAAPATHASDAKGTATRGLPVPLENEYIKKSKHQKKASVSKSVHTTTSGGEASGEKLGEGTLFGTWAEGVTYGDPITSGPFAPQNNHPLYWTASEDGFIKRMKADGATWETIADALWGRSKKEVRNRWKELSTQNATDDVNNNNVAPNIISKTSEANEESIMQSLLDVTPQPGARYDADTAKRESAKTASSRANMIRAKKLKMKRSIMANLQSQLMNVDSGSDAGSESSVHMLTRGVLMKAFKKKAAGVAGDRVDMWLQKQADVYNKTGEMVSAEVLRRQEMERKH